MANDKKLIPYGRQIIEQDDIDAVVSVLRSDFLTTGPVVDQFERAVAKKTGAAYGVSFSSGTAALHGIMASLDLGEGDEVITTPITFAATSNSVLYVGATPVFADVNPRTLLIDVNDVNRKITSKTKAIIVVDYAGNPCEYEKLRATASEHRLVLISDACHALGAEYHGRKVGGLADMTAFSFHPVKHVTTGEGGMVVTNNAEYYMKLRRFRNHGICDDYKARESKKTWCYEIETLGYNYRLSDIQCALGVSQLNKLDVWVERRNKIARKYDLAFKDIDIVQNLETAPNSKNAYHLYVLKVPENKRSEVFSILRTDGIGVNVHYTPVYYHPLYKRLGYEKGICPVAEMTYEQIISLPIFPALTEEDQDFVISRVKNAIL